MASGSKKKKNQSAKEYPIQDPQTGIVFKNMLEFQNARLEQLTLRQKEKAEEKEKAQKKLIKQAEKKREELNIGVSRRSSSPPKHAEEKTEYVKSKGGHEASGTGDEGGDGRKDKKDHGDGGGSGGGGGRGGGGRGRKQKEVKIYCPKCCHSFSFKDLLVHDCKKLQSKTAIDG